ncbi:serine carboxypeptidase-like 31 [Olea europaea var. sylvestris]|uniref:Carboxypeptidase n=1 Tax=Olea europaea subsp. europaea TaxID=158383 RepID=A0A8S0SVR1_OLEEU|nr:serine carboxypeptidase-like 31 [Olea europaea var. sylvestris]CAA2995815.1 serine carboxypeptidase-like 31 [Olea europaea subsp. europaea]
MALVLKIVFLIFQVMICLVGFESVADARHRQDQKKSSFGDVKDLVTDLPGQPQVKFRHYAGYVTVNEKNGRALFYWFYEATTLPDEKPLVLWLNGGPGCSSVGYGATQEIGPFLVDTDGHGLKFNSYSWNTEANLLFLESPIGVGFSYSNTSGDYDILEDYFAANDSYVFLHKWFLKFPSYRTRKFYIAGESYAGKYVPELAELIHDRNKDPSLFIDLKGIMLGNPETCDAEDWKGMVDYAWSHAVVSDETHKTIKESCDFYSDDPWSNKDCTQGMAEYYRQYNEIDIYSLYTSVCIPSSEGKKSSLVTVRSSSSKMPRVLGGYDPCMDDYAKSYYNRRDVQKALHVGDGTTLIRNWTICNLTVYSNWSYSRTSVLPIYKKLIGAGLRIWVYSGDTDGRVPFLSTRYSLSSLGLPITMAWRPWYHQKQVGGWIQEYEGLTFATFRGAGHAVPIFKRSESLAFFSSFLSGDSLPYQRT